MERDEQVNSSSFTNTLTFPTSSTSITIYVSRAFQRAAPRPLIRHYVKKAGLLVSVERNPTLFDIRSGHSSYIYMKTVLLGSSHTCGLEMRGTVRPYRTRTAPNSHARRQQNALLKLLLRSERATGALAIVNRHSYRFRALLAADRRVTTALPSRDLFSLCRLW